MSQDYQTQLEASRQVWDSAAATFDDEPDHGLRNPVVRSAWTALLKKSLLPPPASILDIGCGTGSLSVILAELGYSVSGIDLSPAMILRAEEKARLAGYSIPFQAMDAAFPQFPPAHFDMIVCRHLLWTLPEPAQVLNRWSELLKPRGRLFLVEGFWNTGAGLHATELAKLLPPSIKLIHNEYLSDQPDLWGGAVTDERYAITADRAS